MSLVTPTLPRRTFLGSLGTLSLAGLGCSGSALGADGTAETATTTGWSQYRAGPGRTGAVSGTAAPDGAYATTAWTADTDNHVFVDESVVADGAVYLPFIRNDRSFRGGVLALDAETGAERWRYDAPSGEPGLGGVSSAPAVGEGRLYLTSRPGVSHVPYGGLHAIDTETGEVRWERTDEEWADSPLFADGTLYAEGGEDGSAVNAIDPETGEIRWRDATASNEYFGFADGLLYGVRYHSDDGNELVAWRCEDGTVELSKPLPNGVDPARAAVAGGRIYSSNQTDDRANEVVAHDASGECQWRTRLTPDGELGQENLSRPAVADDTVYVSTTVPHGRGWQEGTQSTLHAVDVTTGDMRWSSGLSTLLSGDPAVAGDSVYVAGQTGSPEDVAVHALSAEEGTEKWGYRDEAFTPIDVMFATTPTIADGRLYVGRRARGAGGQASVIALTGTDEAPDDSMVPPSSSRPVAVLMTDPEDAEYTNHEPGTTVRLDGSASTGNVQTYEWRRGSLDSFEEAGPAIEVTLCGRLEVTLRVTDDESRQDTVSLTLETAGSEL